MDLHAFRPVAVRAWTTPTGTRAARSRRGRRQHPTALVHALVFDTETTTDTAQTLLFGALRYCRLDPTVDGVEVTTVAEDLIYPDHLPARNPDGYACLQRYARTRKASIDPTYLGVEPCWELQLYSRSEFVDRWVWRVGYPHNERRDPALVVAFNAPFDLSRIAVDVAEARDDMHGGFSLTLWHDREGRARRWRPRLAIKALDAKRALKKFRRRERGGRDHTGHLLDLRTLVFALTGDSHSLDSACTAFGVPGKTNPAFGVITEEAIDYCRQDVAATTGLLEAALSEHARHPVELQPTRAYSSASVAKAYLAAMGIPPRLTIQPEFPPQVLGWSMAAFYGGRAEIHIRHTRLPVTLVDFTSMYPTVDILLGMWALVTAARVDVVEVTDEINQMLGALTPEDCFQPDRWREWVVIGENLPDGDVLPVRAGYRDNPDGQPGWSIGINPLYADTPFWYALPDLIASKVLTGKPPRVRRAYRFVPVGRQPGLTPVALRGEVTVDPVREDFFKAVVHGRQNAMQRTRGHPGACLCPDCRTAGFLKVLANAGSYGIYAEMIRHELASDAREPVTVYPPFGEPFEARVGAPEEPGRFCFPPIAAVITAAARLMLALLEHTLTTLGGTWMFCDTDSLAIVATPTGGPLPCEGGNHRLPDGRPAVLAVSTAQVATARARFNALNPYDLTLVPHLLKIDTVGECYTVSAKRYVIPPGEDQ